MIEDEFRAEESSDIAANLTPTLSGLSITQALEQLRLRLLDLTGRNRLINFKHGPGKTIQFVDSDFNAMFERIAGDSATGVKLEFIPEPSRDDWETKNGRLVRPDAKVYASRIGKSTSYDLATVKIVVSGRTKLSAGLQTLYYADELGKHGRKLAREAKLAIEETGSNMLYLVFGFLEFPDSPGSDKFYQAPMLCVPVTISISDEGQYSTFTLISSGEELTDNLSLREKVKRDFGLNLPTYLDEDDESADAYLVRVANTVKDLPGWRVQRRITLTLLSFANMLMVKDNAPETWIDSSGNSALLNHPLIRQVFEGSHLTSGEPAYASEYDIDAHPRGDLPLIYDADSSQHSALIDVLEGKNRVIEGPPGTGKSQTITNIIAAAMQAGKTVLFVAEKLAALEVVKSRLEQAGLENFVLELHSNKTNKKRVLEDLKHRLEMSSPRQGELPALMSQLQEKKDELRFHMEIMRGTDGNAVGLTLHQIIWRAERHRARCGNESTVLETLEYLPAAVTTSAALAGIYDNLKYAAQQFEAIEQFSESHPFWGFFPNELTPHNAIPIQQILATYLGRFRDFQSGLERALGIFGTDEVSLDNATATKLIHILADLAPANPDEINFNLLLTLFPRSGKQEMGAAEESLQVLKELATAQELLCALERSRDQTLIANSIPTASEEAQGKELLRQITLTKLEERIREQFEQMFNNLRPAVNAGILALRELERLAERFNIAFEGSAGDVKKLLVVRSVLEDAPTQVLHLRSEHLKASTSLETLKRMAEELKSIQSSFDTLDKSVYMDSIPLDSELSEAIAVLREGNVWYRIFQGRWRKAVNLHKRLVRNKTIKLTPDQRLAELESIRKYSKRQDAWKKDEVLKTIAGAAFDGEATPFPDLIKVASWLVESSEKFADSRITCATLDLLKITRADIIELINATTGLKEAISELNSVAAIFASIHPEELEISQRIAQANWNERLFEYGEFAETLNAVITFMTRWVKPSAALKEGVIAIANAAKIPDVERSLALHVRGLEIFGSSYRGRDTNLEAAFAAHAYGRRLLAACLPDSILQLLLSVNSVANQAAIEKSIIVINKGWQDLVEFEHALSEFGEVKITKWAGCDSDKITDFAQGLVNRTDNALKNLSSLLPWAQYLQAREACRQVGLMDYLRLVEVGSLSPRRLTSGFAFRFYASIAEQVFRQNKKLRTFSGTRHSAVRKDFVSLDREVIKMRGAQVARDCMKASTPPQGASGVRVDDKTELRLLEHLIPQQRPRVPLRKLLSRSGKAIQALKPCFMMGPQAVAQFLQPGQLHFDIVIMDEASQLKPEQAIGAIARGTQLVVVGDPKQLPPTSFFARMATQEDDGDSGKCAAAVDAESILDVCISHFHPVRTLRWHYRSQHESLIAFSNQNFYRGNLVVFPSPFGKSKELGLRYQYVKNGIYEGQMNVIEARQVVEAVASHIQARPENSLGVVTLNVKQRDLIEEMLEERLKTVNGADDFKMHWKAHGMELFVKNLENVQGDERDCIIISTTFGRPATAGVVRQNFGPISRGGGWRRLNVLFTRAKKSVVVFSSMQPEDIVVDNSTPEGTKALRNYLLFARDNVLTQNEETNLPPDSDFEIAILDLLKGKGYEVVPQLGVAGFRIDIAVRHPDYKSVFLAAIECDGASYHSGVTVRDRDRIRQEILEGLGWRGRIWRIWSTDWFRNPQLEAERLFSFLDERRSIPLPIGDSYDEVKAEGDDAELQASDKKQGDGLEVSELILETTDDEIEVRVGDLVTYFNIESPDIHLSVQITTLVTDLNQGLIGEGTPLAQVLLGATPGDEVVLRVTGKPAATLHIQNVYRKDLVSLEPN